LTANDTVEIERGTNPDIVFEFFQGELETSPRLDLTGAVITTVSNIPGFAVPPFIEVDLTQGIILIPVSVAISSGLKKFTDYVITVQAVDADTKIHRAHLGVVAK
jgi:hypothetical protein